MAGIFTIIGYAIGGPVGALIGGFLDQVFFPKEGVKGPRLNELNVQRSTVGHPIPIVYGTAALAGNVIWSSGLVETKHEDEQGGKFGIGGTKVTSYTYSVDIAIGICEGEISGIRRIWADADLIYDASSDSDLLARLLSGDPEQIQAALDEAATTILEVIAGIRAMSAQLYSTMAVYLGTEDQMPDPTIEGHVGDVSAYRGLAYIVFDGFQLEKWGNRIPNFRFEIYSGSEIECGIYTAGYLEPWQFAYDTSTRDPRNRNNQHNYGYMEDGGLANTTYEAALADINAATDHPDNPFVFEKIPQHNPTYIHGWSITTAGGGGLSQPCGIEVDDLYANPAVDYITVQMSINALEVVSDSCPGGDGSGFEAICAGFWALCGGKHRDPVHVLQKTGGDSGYWVLTDHDEDPEPWFETSNASSDVDHYIGQTLPCADLGEGPFDVWRLSDHEIGVRRDYAPVSNWAVTWTRVTGTFKSLSRYNDTSGGGYGSVLTYPIGPTLRSDDLNYNNQAFWEAAYAAALADAPLLNSTTSLPDDWVYGVDYPTITNAHPTNFEGGIWRADCTAVDAVCVPMSEIVTDICRRAGLRTDTATQIDVSDLTTCVNGYVIGRQMSARDALGPLRMFGLWDAVESDALLKFVERGHAIVDTLTSDDLGAHEAGSQAPTAVEASRLQEKDLPRRLRLHFANFEHDHEVSEQSASRITTEAVDELDVELPISMTPDTAKQLAEIMLYAQWVGRDTFRFSLDNNWLGLEPTDCVELPVDGQTERVRIVAVNYSIGGICQIEAQRDDDGSYVSTAVATPGTPSGGAIGGPGSGPICPSEVVLLDLPRLNAAHIDAGYYAAIYSTCPEMDSWACAELYRSNDGGVTFGRVARTNEEVTVGEIDTITGPATDPTLPGDSPAYDASNSITVTLFVGELASVTDAQIDAGQNMAAIGQDGQWVIIQFKTAVLDTGNTWVLTDLIWGLNDTQHLLGTTGTGDTFVLLSDPALLRIPESADAIGQSKEFKVVTCGEAIDAVTEFDFTTWGLSYLRPCPSTVISATTTEPPVGADDGDAYLLPNDTSLSGVWADHGGEIAKWSDETDSWVYCTPGPGTIIHVIDVSDTSSTDGGGGDVIVDEDGNPTPAPWAPSDPTYVTVDDETAQLPNSEQLQTAILDVLSPGDNIVFTTDTGSGVTTISGESALEFQDEGIALGEVNTVNFVGPGVTSSVDSSGVLDVVIPGGGTGDVLVSGAGIYAIADESRSLTTTLTDDPALQATLEANTTYHVRFLVYADTNATADYKSDIHFTGTTTSSFLSWSHNVATTASIPTGVVGGAQLWIVASPGINYEMVVANTGNQTNLQHVDLTIETGASGGVLSYRWAQNTSNAGATVRRRNSCMIVNGGDVGDTGSGTTLEFEDEGTPLGAVNTVNFVGAGVTSTLDSSGVLEVNIPSGGGGGGGSSGNCVFQDADMVITSNTTPTDTDLTIELEPGTHAIDAFCIVTSNATPDMNVRLNYTGTVTGFRSNCIMSQWPTGSEFVSGTSTHPHVIFIGTTAAFGLVFDTTIEVSTSGTLSIQAYQGTSSATAVTFHSGSRLCVGTGGGDTGGGGSLTASNGVQLVADDIQLDINGLTSIGTITPSTDQVALWDDSLGAHRKASVQAVISAATGVALTPVAESVVVGSAATTLTIGSLDLDTDEVYVLVIALKNATASNSGVSLYYNADTTATNYFIDITSNGSATQSNNALFATLGTSTNAQVLAYGLVSRAVNRVLANLTNMQTQNTAATTRAQGIAHVWSTTATNVTGITISSAVANTLDIGSRLQIYRLTQ